MADVPPGVKGMNDILPPEVSKWQFLEEKAREVLESFAYRELRTPVLEYTPLFVRVGRRGDRRRREADVHVRRPRRPVGQPAPRGDGARRCAPTSSTSQWNKEPVTRWYYMGPMFRHERAQRGRLRQFHQIGAEFFGVAEPTADAEMIAMLVAMFDALRAAGRGDRASTSTRWASPRSAPAYRDALVDVLRAAPRRAGRRLAAAAGDRTRCASSTRRAPTMQALDANAPSCSTRWATRRRPASPRCARHLDALGVRARASTRASCAGSTTTRRRSSRSRRRRRARRAEHRRAAAAATTAWSARWAGRRRRRIGFALGVERALLAHARAGRELRAGR